MAPQPDTLHGSGSVDPAAMDAELVLEAGTLDLRRGVLAKVDGSVTRLTPKERALLAFLAARPGVVVDRQTLLTDVWGYAPGVVSRAVDKTMARLRSKVEQVPAEPRHLVGVAGEGYRFEPLVVASVEPPSTGPVLFGREDLLARVLDLLRARGGVWTLHGPGGVGKTSMAAALMLRWDAETRVVWLANHRDEAAVDAAVDAVLGVRGAAGRTAAARGLGAGLLVLDNAEQAVEAVARVAEELHRAAPQLRVVVTSRFTLPEGASGRAIAVPALDAAAGRALFLARSSRLEPSARSADLDALVADLDGLPLAIELAAGRLDHVSVADLRARLPQRLALLRSSASERDARHQSVHAALAWSWDLLSAAEQEALAGCAVFQAGFDLDAAEAVLGEAGAWDRLPSLVRRSFVQRTDHPGGSRFSLHGLVRVFVRHRAGAPDAARLHRRWFADRAAEWSTAIHTRASDDAWTALAAERPNLEAAFESAVSDADLDAAMKLAAGLQPLLRTRGPVAGWHTLTHTLVQLSAGHPHHARARVYRGVFRLTSGDVDGADADLRFGLHEAERLAIPDVAAMAAIRWAFVHDLLGREGAGALLDRARELAATHGLSRIEALALGDRGIHDWRNGRFAAAEACFEQGDRLFARAGDVVQRASTAVNRGHNARARGQDGAAVVHFHLAARLGEATGFRRVSAVARIELADIAMLDGQVDVARSHLERARTDGEALGSDELLGVVQVHELLVAGLHHPHSLDHIEAARTRLQQVDTQAADATWFGLALSGLLRRATDPTSAAACLAAAVSTCGDPVVARVLADDSAPLPDAHLDLPYLRRWRWAQAQVRGAALRSSARN